MLWPWSGGASDFKQELLSDPEVGMTGVTFDVGAFYSSSSALKIGLTLQNLVPMKQLSSGYTLGFQSLQFARDRDSVGRPIINVDGDRRLERWRGNMQGGRSRSIHRWYDHRRTTCSPTARTLTRSFSSGSPVSRVRSTCSGLYLSNGS